MRGGAVTDAVADTVTDVESRTRLTRVLLWLVVAVLGVRQMAVVLRQPPGERLTDLETWIGENGVLHGTGSLYDGDRFTGTPFAGLVLKPLTASAEASLGVAWTFGSLLLVAALGVVAARALPKPVGRRTALLAAPVAITLLMLSLPVRNTLHLGQTSILPVLLVLLAWFAARDDRLRGVLVGLAAALQPTLLLFAVLLWLTGRRRASAASLATFALGTAAAWAAVPKDSWTYWIHHVAGAGLGERPDSLANQSLHGALLRLGLEGPVEIALFLVLAAAVAFIGVRRAVRYAQDGQLLLAVAVTGCVVVAVSPTAWQHQLLWVLLAVVGKVGKRASDRLVWPAVVVLVVTLPGQMLLPNVGPVTSVRDNALLLAALGAACATPFLLRTSPYWARPVPTDYARPVAARWRRVPLLPFWRRVLHRPNLLLELLLIRVVYSAYAQVRLAATAGRPLAEEHGRQIHAIEQWLHIDIELWVNHTVVEITWLREFFDYYYSTFHFIVPLAILGVLYARRPADYRWARTSIGFATVLALVGFWLYPLAPPRLMPGLGFIDTIHGVQDFAKPDYGTLTGVTNQYAAMPSLHFGWSLWCGVVIVILAPKLWMKALGLLHPLFTIAAIVATANHWVLDAVGGALVVSLGFGLTYLLSGPRKLQPVTEEKEAAPEPAPDPARDPEPVRAEAVGK
ncbi:bifunctional glycosyltransferase 87/phosphatase PAP2 family protein [Streptomyces bacillaris]|uniref:bifunctional glycosyltransferase 87/phosphatase PAP2 family protein n=1 Tax=Streptomyces TaxID=1883 RepID=UPI0006AD21FE|nr:MULTISPECIES: bifunctional glycosyltransferase 87/phosphatase PAP2 family protein [Streptomyces]ALC30157.1 membrane protein [Streptomyces sp. CFMR 7]MBT3073918.1 phosphatase PAP2 family protein [Streptomyces sp. COG21]MBT3083828.1 phosphatase PAP2 family protein [Streptomyces sp. COG20]MBT3088790.1 phosphatase PAP2 family protein [Streptomyces sp. CYG21]MBT3096715.1 phosphatase PAP2 family protein [Streptomyces sp. CBG30]